MLMRPSTPIRDGELAIVPLGREHLSALEAVGSDPLVQRFTRVPEPFGPAEAEWWLGHYERGWEDGSRAGFAILDGPGETFVGMIGFVALRLDDREGEIGYVVAPEARGRGVATRALSLMTAWGFAELGLARIELRAELANPASIRVAERCGYEREGILRNVHLKGQRRGDMAVYAQIAPDAKTWPPRLPGVDEP